MSPRTLLRESVSGTVRASCGFLRHVQQQLLVVGFHFRKKFAQFGKVNGLAACASRKKMAAAAKARWAKVAKKEA